MRRSKLPALFIGLRYLLAKRDNRFIAFTSLISMAGLTLGVLALVVVLSVFNGSQGMMRDRTLLTVPHANLSAIPAFLDWQQARNQLLQQPGIVAVAPYTEVEALLSEKGYHQVTQVRGIDPTMEVGVSTLPTAMLAGSLNDLIAGNNGIVIGRSLADNLRLNMGDNLNLVVPLTNSASNRIKLEMHRFTVVGIFDVQFTIGADLAYVDITDSAALLGDANPTAAVHLRLKTSDIDQAKTIVQEAITVLNTALPGPLYTGKDWSTTESSLFNALRLEKFMTWLMLMMIVAIGAFNIVSTLVMVVAEKQPDIAILRTMGARQSTILAIFLVQGTAVGVLGISIGAAIGTLIAKNFTLIASSLEQWLSPNSLYLISALPARWQLSDVVITCAVAMVISFLATLYPAWKASQIQPAQVLRYA